MPKEALLLVDLQNDFMPGGALAVAQGDEVVPVANRLLDRFEIAVATQDWHPADHGSFASQHAGKVPGERIMLEGLEQILWPDHCVMGSHGAAFHSDLRAASFTAVFQKGADPRVDSYSGFFDNGRRHATGLADWLRAHDVEHLYVMGLATDYCVRFTVVDACDLGFRVTLLVDGCRGVELAPGDVAAALEEMRTAGAELASSDDLSP